MIEKNRAKKLCPICKKQKEDLIVNICTDAYKFVIKRIKEGHPDWIEEDGACPKCIEYYKKL